MYRAELFNEHEHVNLVKELTSNIRLNVICSANKQPNTLGRIRLKTFFDAKQYTLFSPFALGDKQSG